MSYLKIKTTRRRVLKSGLLSAAAAVGANDAGAFLRPKAKDETKVVYLGGDQLHNGMGQRQEIRGVLQSTGWRLLFTTDARYLTPEFLSDADLLMITRWGGPIEGWCPAPFQEGAIETDGYMSDELENAIVDNVIKRGMGFIALHCTCWTPERQKFNDMVQTAPLKICYIFP